MGYHKVFLAILVYVLYHCSLCASQPSGQTEHVKVEVDSSHIVFEVDHALYSVGLGCNLLFTRKYNLSSPVLRLLAKELAPAYLRLGGTYCDFLTFHSHADGIPEKYKNKTLSGEIWDAVNDFVSSAGFHFIFDANVFLRNQSDDKWDPSNFQELLRYNAKGGYKVNFQLGNEPNAFPWKFNKTISPAALAGDFKTLRSILKWSNLYQDSLVIGPDTTLVLKRNPRHYLQGFLKEVGGTVDAVSTHFYYEVTDGERLVDEFTDPATLDQFSSNTAVYVSTVEKYAVFPKRPQVWYGESGIQPGSFPSVNVSDRFISGMVWLDKLGICALKGIKVIVRQSLLATIGRSLITVEETPTADYWSAVLFKRLVGTESLKLHKVGGTTDGTDKVRLYAHCTQTDRSVYGYKPGAVTVFGTNFNLFKAVRLELNAEDVDQFLLTPARTNNITSLYVALNGMELSAHQGVLPAMSPKPATSTPVFPAGSMVFFVLKDAEFKICKKKHQEKVKLWDRNSTDHR